MTLAAPPAVRHRAIAGELDRRIIAGEYPVGTRLPSEVELARAFGVARGTLRAALAALQRRGVLEPRPGAGWFVQSAVHAQELSGFRGFAQWARGRGFTPGGRVVDEHEDAATGTEARLLAVSPGEPVLRITRVRTLSGRPVMVERSVYPPRVAGVVRGLPVDTPSYVAVLAAAGFAEAGGSHRIDAVAASSEDAAMLGVRRSSPLLRATRRAFAADGRPIDLSDDRYVPGAVSFEVKADARDGLFGRVLG